MTDPAPASCVSAILGILPTELRIDEKFERERMNPGAGLHLHPVAHARQAATALGLKKTRGGTHASIPMIRTQARPHSGVCD